MLSILFPKFWKMKINTRPSTVLFLSMLAIILSSCGTTGPQLTGQAVNTPDYYSENKVLFVEEDSLENKRFRALKNSYELAYDSAKDVKKLAPLGVIVRKVRLPVDLEKKRDVAVILDVVTAGEESVTSLVVFYQRDVPGGQMLNFQDLLVYYDPEWDGVTPPWFRVRVLEVNSERNTRTSNFLNESNKLAGGLAGIVPHPVLPSVKTAIETAKLVLGNRKNKVILDYQVQFYSRAQIKGAATDLMPLRIGEWVVMGRPQGETSSFWNNTFEINARTDRVHFNNRNQPLNNLDPNYARVPYVSLALMSADAAIPKHILDRSQALLQILDSPTERVNFDALTESVNAINSAVKGYSLERKLKKYRTTEDFQDIINLLKEYKAKKDAGEIQEVKTIQIRSLVRLLGEMTDKNFGGPIEVLKWWNEANNAGGRLEKNEKAKWGVLWVIPSSNN